jgi:hypothetical protein
MSPPKKAPAKKSSTKKTKPAAKKPAKAAAPIKKVVADKAPELKIFEIKKRAPIIDVTQRSPVTSKKSPQKNPFAAPSKTPRLSPAQIEAEKRKAKSAAAVKVAMASAGGVEEEEEEEFDPAAFFAANGGKGIVQAHVMRKERVDFALAVRYRLPSTPLVQNAELINLSKGGLCLRTPDTVKVKTVLRIEIPLPHTAELFAVQAEVVWSDATEETKNKKEKIFNTGMKFMPMSLAKQTVINQFIQSRRDEIVMTKIGLDKFTDSVPVAGLD